MNYAETLAYWYLRLNGFFPLKDFVLHKDDEIPYTSDCDLLAIRFPYVYEKVGGQPEDWDIKHFKGWGLDLEKPLALIVQVKATTKTTGDEGAFSTEYLRAALQRTGLWDITDVEKLLIRLSEAPHATLGQSGVGKLLVASKPRRDEARYIHLELKDALCFIKKRFIDYHPEKMAGRFFFHDELIQFLASAEARP